MEAALRERLRTLYSGGLGVLSGDQIKSCADKGLPGVAVMPMYHRGYGEQFFRDGWQHEDFPHYDPSDDFERLDETVLMKDEGRDMRVGAWRLMLEGNQGHHFPIIALDARICPQNDTRSQALSDHVYGGDRNTRIRQEKLLGEGGVLMLQKLGIEPQVYHKNEGHAAFIALQMLKQGLSLREIRPRNKFTTHTPVPAGHDRFPYTSLQGSDTFDRDGGIDRVFAGDLSPSELALLKSLAGDKECNMTLLAHRTSDYTNGVSKLHGEVMRGMLGDPNIDSITNGVHSYTWTSPHFQKLFDQYLPEWRKDPKVLENAAIIPWKELLAAGYMAKLDLFEAINSGEVVKTTNGPFDPTLLTVGFARRGAEYKRGDLLFYNLERLAEVSHRRIQFVFAGKAHPHDNRGKAMLQRIQHYANALQGKVNVAFLQNYNMRLGQLMTAGCDVWLNNPIRREEASGTSGMKAAHNGRPHLSIFDGWWPEYCHQGGWTFGDTVNSSYERDAPSLYDMLKTRVIPAYQNPKRWAQVEMVGAIKNASHANTHRVMDEYVQKAYGGLPKDQEVFAIPFGLGKSERRVNGSEALVLQ